MRKYKTMMVVSMMAVSVCAAKSNIYANEEEQVYLPKITMPGNQTDNQENVADVDISGPKVDIDAPDVDVNLPKADIDVSVPKIEGEIITEQQGGTGNEGTDTNDSIMDGPDVAIKGPKIGGSYTVGIPEDDSDKEDEQSKTDTDEAEQDEQSDVDEETSTETKVENTSKETVSTTQAGTVQTGYDSNMKVYGYTAVLAAMGTILAFFKKKAMR